MTGNPDSERKYRLTRRRVLAASAAATAGLAGCSSDDGGDTDDGGGNETTPARQPVDADDRPGSNPTAELVDDPPARVYLPTHQDGMQMLSMQQAGEYTVMPHWSYSHTFWLVRGDETTEETPGARSLHFMFMIRDSETGQQLPVNVVGPMRVQKDGNVVGRPGRPWPMISQGMGFHFGDNREFATDGHSGSLPEEGTYEIELQLRPISVRKTGAFAGRFEEPTTASFEFEFRQEQFETINERTQNFEESRWGEAAAAEPMMMGNMEMNGDMGMGLPPAEEYPGELLGRAADGSLPSSHDADFVVSYVEDSRLATDGSGYLAVSPRTPYNRIPLPEMTLSAEGAVDGEFEETLDDELGHHYGLSATLGAGEQFELVVDSPPQVARHRGYQTAFLDMPPMSITR
jgi:hypothetical protein